MNGICSAVGGVVEQLEQLRVDRRAAGDDRARAELVVAELLDLDPGRVGGVGDVDHDRRVGRQRERARARAAEGDLLLGDRHGRELPLGAAGLRPPGARPPARRTSRCGCPARARRAARRAAATGSASITATSPMRTCSRACSPSAAPMSMCRSRISATFLRSSSRSRWIGFLPTTPLTTPARVASATRWPTRICGVPAADRREPQVAVVVDVGDDQPDLVDVAHHEQPLGGALEAVLGATSASGVPITSVLTAANSPAASQPDRGRVGLIAGGAVRGEQVEQQLGERRSPRSNRSCRGLRGAAGPAGSSPDPDGPSRGRAMRPGARGARTGGCRRGGSSRPRAACRCARAHRSGSARPDGGWALTWTSRGGAPPSRRSSPRRGPRSRRPPRRVRPSDSALCPSGNCSGSTPMPTRLERWMRSKLSAITARTPSSCVPFAAQSREEPEPYSLPASTTSGTPSCDVAHRRVVDRQLLALAVGPRWPQVERHALPRSVAPADRAGCAAGCWRTCRASSPRGCRGASRRS